MRCAKSWQFLRLFCYGVCRLGLTSSIKGQFDGHQPANLDQNLILRKKPYIQKGIRKL